ncbi:MAG: outer membrane protein transport protein [Rhodospirillales bacterium]|nr:outer membrane protein transport protein [Rhodospirillales bacterium]
MGCVKLGEVFSPPGRCEVGHPLVLRRRGILAAANLVIWVVLLTAMSTGRDAAASGFYVTQQSARSVGRAAAGQAAGADDAATVSANPAGMTELDGAQVMAGASVLSAKTSFRDRGSTATTPGTGGVALAYAGGNGGNPFRPEVVPNVYAAVPLSGTPLWLGIGVTSPSGLSLDYGADWFGRYDSIDSSLTTIDVSPAIALRVNNIVSLGAGLDVQSVDIRLTSAVPNTLAPGGPSAATDGRSRLRGDDLSVGFNAGILIRPWPTTRIGVHYRSGIDHTLKGRARLSGLAGPLAAANMSADAKAKLRLPDIVTAGVAQEVGAHLTLLADFQWFNWSRLNEVRVRTADGADDIVIPEDYHDSYALSVGGEYRWNRHLSLRAGFRFETTPTSDRYRSAGVPEGNNYSLGLGCSYRPFADVADAVIDLAIFHTRAERADIDISRTFFAGTPAAGRVDIRGQAETHATTLSLGLRYRF